MRHYCPASVVTRPASLRSLAEFYKKQLAKRLLLARSSSDDAERSMIAKLKLRRSKLEAALASSSPGGAPEGGTMKLFGDAALAVYKRVRLEERAAATCVGCQAQCDPAGEPDADGKWRCAACVAAEARAVEHAAQEKVCRGAWARVTMDQVRRLALQTLGT